MMRSDLRRFGFAIGCGATAARALASACCLSGLSGSCCTLGTGCPGLRAVRAAAVAILCESLVRRGWPAAATAATNSLAGLAASAPLTPAAPGLGAMSPALAALLCVLSGCSCLGCCCGFFALGLRGCGEAVAAAVWSPRRAFTAPSLLVADAARCLIAVGDIPVTPLRLRLLPVVTAAAAAIGVCLTDALGAVREKFLFGVCCGVCCWPAAAAPLLLFLRLFFFSSSPGAIPMSMSFGSGAAGAAAVVVVVAVAALSARACFSAAMIASVCEEGPK